jgi:hypothetical protein
MLRHKSWRFTCTANEQRTTLNQLTLLDKDWNNFFVRLSVCVVVCLKLAYMTVENISWENVAKLELRLKSTYERNHAQNLLRCYRKKWYFQILALIKSLSIVLLHFKS